MNRFGSNLPPMRRLGLCLAGIILLSGVTRAAVDPAINPPPISLDVKDAPAADVAAALSRATGSSVRIFVDSRDRWTLDAANQSYWRSWSSSPNSAARFRTSTPA
jgi:hypothetical protein